MRTVTPNRKTALSITCATHVVQDGLSSTIYVLLPILAQAFGHPTHQGAPFPEKVEEGNDVMETFFKTIKAELI